MPSVLNRVSNWCFKILKVLEFIVDKIKFLKVLNFVPVLENGSPWTVLFVMCTQLCSLHV